jgi:succinyl-CoA synthetase beta subunit
MNIHEYQGKQLLKAYGAPVADGVAILSANEAEAAAKTLPGPLYVVKSQIHAGGRGKGKFKELPADAKGGVRLAKSIEEVVANVNEMLGNTLVTKQTGPAGKQVNRLYIEDGADIDRELTCRYWSTAPSAASLSWFPPKAAWTSRPSPRRRRRRSSPSPSTPKPASPMPMSRRSTTR